MVGEFKTTSCKSRQSLTHSTWILVALLFLMSIIAPVTRADRGSGKVIELADSDREFLDSLLGPGVVGKAVPAPVIENPLHFLPLRACDWNFRVASGKASGMTRPHSLRPLKREEAIPTWSLSPGSHHILYLRISEDGSISAVSEQDADQGMVIRFSPHVPILLPSLAPGESKSFKIDVKLYDLSHPDHLKHEGDLELTFSYLGAFEVNVPAGNYEACLIKWEDRGKIGPAKVEDIHYRFFAKHSGLVAQVDKRNISAFLLYNEHIKEGEVLTELCIQ